LACLSAAFAEIARDPLNGGKQYRCDPEGLALTWRNQARRQEANQAARQRGTALLTAAAETSPRAAYVLALDHFRSGPKGHGEGRGLLLGLCSSDAPESLKAAAYRKLAVDAERRLKNLPLSLEYAESALAFLKNESMIQEAEKIRRRRRRFMNIRVMTINDYEKAYALWKNTTGISLRNTDDSKEGIERFLNRNPGTCFIAEEGEELLGTILGGHDGRRGRIYHLAVKTENRNKRLGITLLEAVEKALVDQGISKVGLASIKTNVGGNRFWHACGFPIRNDIVYRDKILLGGPSNS
jgi:ribosomal protein S18 acetylase RimI-like enzyme